MRYDVFVNGKKAYEAVWLSQVVDGLYVDGLLSPEMMDVLMSRIAEEVDVDAMIFDVLDMAVSNESRMANLRGTSRRMYRILSETVDEALSEAGGDLSYATGMDEVRIAAVREEEEE